MALCVAVIALPNGDSGGGGDDDNAASSGGGASAESVAPAEPAEPRALKAAPSAAPAPNAALDSGRTGFAPGRSDRRIERSVALELADRWTRWSAWRSG